MFRPIFTGLNAFAARMLKAAFADKHPVSGRQLTRRGPGRHDSTYSAKCPRRPLAIYTNFRRTAMGKLVGVPFVSGATASPFTR